MEEQVKWRYTLSRSELILVLLTIAYRIELDIIYKNIISTQFGYWNYYDRSDLSLNVLSWFVLLILFIPVVRLFKYYDQLSVEVFLILFVFSIVPFTTLIKYGHFDSVFIICNILFWLLFFVAFDVFNKHSRHTSYRISKERYVIKDKLLKAAVIVFLIVVLFISGYYTGFRITFQISNSIDLREESIQYSIPTILNYLFLWSQAIVPVLLAYFLKKRNYLFTMMCVVTQLFSYGINGMKTTLFVTIVIIAIACVPALTIKKTNIAVFGLFNLFCILGIAEWYLLHTRLIAGVVILRMMFLPNSISYYYYDYFQTHTPDYFRASFLRHLGFSSPNTDLFQTIGQLYFNSNMRCNDGLIGDAFANMGFIGVIVLPIAMAFFLMVLDRCTKDLDIKVYLGVGFVIAIRFMSSYFVTNLLSYGFIILVLLFQSLSREKDST